MITATVDGKVRRWLYDVGALVAQGDVIAEIEIGESTAALHAPASGRLTEMMALPGDVVEAGKVIGWIDELGDGEDVPQPLSALIDAPERKAKQLKPLKRKPRPALRVSSRLLILIGLLAALGIGALLSLLVIPIRSPIVVVTQPVVIPVTAPPLPPQPTPRFRLQERVILKNTNADLPWGTQGIVENSGYDPSYGAWYDVRFGETRRRISEDQIDSVAVLAPTPTMRYDFREWNWSYPLMLAETIGDFPAGTRVVITSGMFDGEEWQLSVTTQDGRSLTVPESLLAVPPDAPFNPAMTPTMRYDFRIWNPSSPLMLTEWVGDFPTGTRVTLASSYFNGVEWELDVVTENGVTLHVRESQLAVPPDSPQGLATPTPGF